MAELRHRALKAVKRLAGSYPVTGEVPLTEKEYAKLYDPVESFTNYLPWLDYDPGSGVYEFDDGVNVGAVFELDPVDVDGRPPEVLNDLEDNLTKALHSIPQDAAAPWILQVYLQDEPILPAEEVDRMRRYARPEARETEHAKAWFKVLEEHYTQLARNQGLFYDPATGSEWKGVNRRIRVCFYRRNRRSAYLNAKGKPLPGAQAPSDELNNAVIPFMKTLEQLGMRVRRCDGADLYHWMLPWLSPAPTGYDNPYDYLRDRPYPDPEDMAIGFDLGHAVTTEAPRAEGNNARDNNGTFYFCGRPQRYISLQAIDKPPKTGLLTADQKIASEQVPALWDRLPRDMIFSMTIVVLPKQELDQHIERLLKRTGAASYEEDLAVEQANQAQEAMAAGRRIYPVYAGFFVRADDPASLNRKTLDAITMLRVAGLNPTDPKDDPVSKTAFLRALPMAYDFRYDQQYLARSRLTYTSHIARLLPFYGRGRGTGNPGFIAFNRIGETMSFDPYRKGDRKMVAHGMIFGPTGAGKSAMVVGQKMHSMAMRRPRQFFIDKGGSFSLLARWYERMGLSVNSITFTPSANISLPPYGEAAAALAQIEAMAGNLSDPATLVPGGDDDADEAFEDEFEDEQRDYLGEMELLTQLMITGSEEKEQARMTRQDHRAIQLAIINALKETAGTKPHPLPSDVCEQFEAMAERETGKRHERLREMADDLRLWTDGVRGHFFNRSGVAWPEADSTFLNLGILSQAQNRDMLSVAFISLINAITGLGEKYQYQDRETEVTVDEAHLITNRSVLVQPLLVGVKIWRKLTIWLDQSTQNLVDFPDDAEPMLSLAEWWYCLAMSKKEVDDVARFRQLNDEQKHLLRSASKEPGNYTEGVVISENLTSLFRLVTPGLPLALAQTDGDEKTQRRKIAGEMGFKGHFAELDAALEVARGITAGRERQAA